MARNLKSPYLMLISPVGACILGILFKFRVLPFLKDDTIKSGGRMVNTADFANMMARMFFIFAGFSLVVAVLYIAMQLKRKRSQP